MFAAQSPIKDNRAVDRDEVHFHAQAHMADGSRIALLVVNISPLGLMARCSRPFDEDQPVSITLPNIGTVKAHIRWSLGGRVGCQFERTIERVAYYDLLVALQRR